MGRLLLIVGILLALVLAAGAGAVWMYPEILTATAPQNTPPARPAPDGIPSAAVTPVDPISPAPVQPPVETPSAQVPNTPAAPPITTPTPNAPTPPPAKVPYTVDPITVDAGLSPKQAHQQFVEHYGEDRVVRILIKITDGAPTEGLAPWLKRTAPTIVPAGMPPSVYVAVNGQTAALIVAPVRDAQRVAFICPWAPEAKYDSARRLVSAELPAEFIPPPLGTPKETAKITELREKYLAETDKDRRRVINRAISCFRSPAAITVFLDELERVTKPNAKLDDILPPSQGLEMMGRTAAPYFVEKFNDESTDLGRRQSILFALKEVGDATTIPALKAWQEIPEVADIAGKTLAEVEARVEKERAEEEAARSAGEEAAPVPLAPDVKFALRSVDFAAECKRDPAAANEKYHDQIVQLTGVVVSADFNVYPAGSKLGLQENEPDGSFDCLMTDPRPWQKMSPGQKVTLKGKADLDIPNQRLRECVILKVEGPPPPSLTFEAFAAEFAADPDAATKKYVRKWLELTGEIATVDIKTGNYVTTMKTASEGITMKMATVYAMPETEGDHFTEGAKIRVVGRFDEFENGWVRVNDCLLRLPGK